VGAWATPEINKAVEMGYTVLEIFEVYHYENSMTGLFAKYIDKFLGLKVEASGWPAGVVTDQQKEDFITEFFEKESVILDPLKMMKNPGLRMLAKLCLNSFCKCLSNNRICLAKVRLMLQGDVLQCRIIR
jgi:hypothetical protein